MKPVGPDRISELDGGKIGKIVVAASGRSLLPLRNPVPLIPRVGSMSGPVTTKLSLMRRSAGVVIEGHYAV